MPCRDDWPSPTGAQARSQRAAKLLIYLYGKKKQAVTEKLRKDAEDCYCDTDNVKVLCAELTALSDKEFDKLVYNPRERGARDLADWWEEHQEADKQREAAEDAVRKRQELRLGALKKLSREEIEALEISDFRIGQWMKGRD
jgi:hypothetical protein